MNFFSIQVFQLGPLAVPGWVLYALAGTVSGAAAIIPGSKGKKEEIRTAGDILTGAFLAGLIVWKLFPVLMAPAAVIKNPLLVLYARGGIYGAAAGTAAAAVYIIYRIYRIKKTEKLFRRDIVRLLLKFTATAVSAAGILIILSSFLTPEVKQESDNMVISAVPLAGNKAPDFELADTEGTAVSLESFKGQWVVLNFWATWCPPCKAELPVLIDFQENYSNRGVVVLGINAAATEKSPGHVAGFSEDAGINFPVLLDIRNRVSSLYGVTSLPTTFIITPDGMIAESRTGAADPFWLKTSVKSD